MFRFRMTHPPTPKSEHSGPRKSVHLTIIIGFPGVRIISQTKIWTSSFLKPTHPPKYERTLFGFVNLPKYERSLISQLRLGILPIRIETGRYSNLPEQQRICFLCDTNQVENELHFLFHCHLYDVERNQFEQALNISFIELTDKDKFTTVFQHPFMLGRYLRQAIRKRREKLYRWVLVFIVLYSLCPLCSEQSSGRCYTYRNLSLYISWDINPGGLVVPNKYCNVKSPLINNIIVFVIQISSIK